MIRQQFNIENYWKVIVYYNLDYNFFNLASYDLSLLGFPIWSVRKILWLFLKKKIKAVTCTNSLKHTSIVLISIHQDVGDFLNSIIHEAEHVKQVMLEAYSVKDAGEPPAYTIGYLVKRMYDAFKSLI